VRTDPGRLPPPPADRRSTGARPTPRAPRSAKRPAVCLEDRTLATPARRTHLRVPADPLGGSTGASDERGPRPIGRTGFFELTRKGRRFSMLAALSRVPPGDWPLGGGST